MRRHRVVICFLAAIAIVSSVGCLYRYHNAACKQRGVALSTRIEKLKQDAHEQLKVGTKKEAVIQFFEAHEIPFTFTATEVNGAIHASGCAPSGCGTDDVLVGVRVKVDASGTVVSEPVVGSLYTDCL